MAIADDEVKDITTCLEMGFLILAGHLSLM